MSSVLRRTVDSVSKLQSNGDTEHFHEEDDRTTIDIEEIRSLVPSPCATPPSCGAEPFPIMHGSLQSHSYMHVSRQCNRKLKTKIDAVIMC